MVMIISFPYKILLLKIKIKEMATEKLYHNRQKLNDKSLIR
jgi:hypothetical protein